MAKGRRLTSSRSERLLGLGTFNHGGGAARAEVADFGEDDVWSMMEHAPETTHHGGSPTEWTPRAALESVKRRPGIITGARDRHVGGLSLAFEDETTPSKRIVHQFSGSGGGGGGGRRVVVPSSAPVNVPDWSKILRVDSAESMHDSDEDDRVGIGGGDSGGIVPPHEYLARSRKMHAMSVYEGVGRTLKGRDLSRVRDAVWSQTGFEG